MIHDVAVVGGGIVGLAAARAVVLFHPGTSVVVLEKEAGLARHQTGRNSGVVHSGIYYRPGSLKAGMCIAGSRSIVEYARQRGIPAEVTGKLIVATRPDELERLEGLHRRGLDHGLEVRWLDASQAREHEPHVAAIAAVHVASTGIVDYVAVTEAMADDVRAAGGEVRTSAEVTQFRGGRGVGTSGGPEVGPITLHTAAGEVTARHVVNCAGLQSDRVAALTGADRPARIVPFRGEYFELRPDAAALVRGLVYPVPDPDFPFLGVHLTRGIDGTVHAGPNAVLAMGREGYRWRDVRLRDLADTLGYRGFRTLARRNLRQGLAEMQRSVRKSLFVRELQRLVPAITASDLVRSPAGVRAQAVAPDGSLVDDFLIESTAGSDGTPAVLNVLNAPSPAATSSLEIGDEIARRLWSG